MEGRKEGRKEGRMGRQVDGQMDGWKEEGMEGGWEMGVWMDEKKAGGIEWISGWKEGEKELKREEDKPAM